MRRAVKNGCAQDDATEIGIGRDSKFSHYPWLQRRRPGGYRAGLPALSKPQRLEDSRRDARYSTAEGDRWKLQSKSEATILQREERPLEARQAASERRKVLCHQAIDSPIAVS
jgi:hypothetical protein